LGGDGVEGWGMGNIGGHALDPYSTVHAGKDFLFGVVGVGVTCTGSL